MKYNQSRLRLISKMAYASLCAYPFFIPTAVSANVQKFRRSRAHSRGFLIRNSHWALSQADVIFVPI